MEEDAHFRPNWLAIFATVLFLIIIGWLAGLLAGAPDGQTIHCDPLEVVVTIPAEEGGEIAYCEVAPTN
jgi:hypothetical protein